MHDPEPSDFKKMIFESTDCMLIPMIALVTEPVLADENQAG